MNLKVMLFLFYEKLRYVMHIFDLIFLIAQGILAQKIYNTQAIFHELLIGTFRILLETPEY